MDINDIKKLTDEELRIKVAELLGWTEIDANTMTGIDPWLERVWGIPNYPTDLNACHEMEKRLVHTPDESTWSEYRECLVGMLGKEWGFATARQRCDAFVLTLG